MCTRALNNPPTINLLEEKAKISYFFFLSCCRCQRPDKRKQTNKLLAAWQSRKYTTVTAIHFDFKIHSTIM